MDELGSKLKSLFKGSGSSKFTGQGHRLGSAEESGSTSKGRTPPPPPPRRAPPPSEPCAALQPATEFSPFTAVTGGGAARTTNSMSPGASSSAPPTNEQSPAAPPVLPPPVAPLVPPVAVTDRDREEQQACLALIASQPAAAPASLAVLAKILHNLLAAPQEPKFRQLRLGPNPSPKIKAALLDVPGALPLLEACGFVVTSTPDSCAVFVDDSRLPLVDAGLLQVQLVLSTLPQQEQPTQQQQPAQQQPQQQQQQPAQPVSGVARAPPAVVERGAAAAARATQVLLPVAPTDLAVPDWFFERSSAEVAAEYRAALSARAANQVFRSKAAAGGSSSRSGKHGGQQATLRVRFPEGVCLQGCFNAAEPLSAVHAWVASSLRHPDLRFSLVAADTRQPLPAGPGTTVGAAGLAGHAALLLNFRATDAQPGGGGYLLDAAGRQQPYLSDELLQQARVD